MAYPDVVLADSPRLYWRMGEASGLPQDTSGNALHATTTSGSPDYSQAGAIVGDANTAIAFDGSGPDYFQRTDNALLDLADVFTLECWVKLTALDSGSTAHGLISKQTGAYYMRILSADGKLQLLRSETTLMVSSTVGIADTTTFHHCVGTKTGATTKLYIDGVDRTGTVTNDTCANNALALFVGAEVGGAEPAKATIDEVAVYPTALSAARVLAHYDSGMATAGTVVAWLTA